MPRMMKPNIRNPPAGNTITTHEEVLEAGQVIVPKLTTLIRGVLRQL